MFTCLIVSHRKKVLSVSSLRGFSPTGVKVTGCLAVLAPVQVLCGSFNI